MIGGVLVLDMHRECAFAIHIHHVIFNSIKHFSGSKIGRPEVTLVTPSNQWATKQTFF